MAKDSPGNSDEEGAEAAAAALAKAETDKLKKTYAGFTGKFSKLIARNPSGFCCKYLQFTDSFLLFTVWVNVFTLWGQFETLL